LLLELRGEPYNKAQRRRELQRLLDRRTEPAIERKHQNISAVLIEMGLPYVSGYKPLRNYQELLRQIVQERVALTPELIRSVQAAIDGLPPSVPSVNDILSILVEPPVTKTRVIPSYVREARPRPYVHRVNYLMLETQNSALGRAGEEFVVNFERARLLAEGQEQLAAHIEQVSLTKGDQEGFDVLSFSADGRDRLIEVKTTTFGAYTPFFVTRNEFETSKEKEDQYYVYRLFTFRRNPHLFILSGAIDQSCELEPTQFIARVG
jgi:hypothetical protein